MKKTLFALIVLVLVLSFPMGAFARNNVAIMKGDEQYLVLGSIKDISDDDVTITVDRVLGRVDSELVGKDVSVKPFTYSYCELHTPATFNMPVISDNIVISLDASGKQYVCKNGAYKVDTNDYATCKIIKFVEEDDAECIVELAEITCYVRSNSMVSSFEYDSDGNIYAVYPQKPEQCVVAVDNSGNTVVSDDEAATVSNTVPMTPQVPREETAKHDLRWVYAIGIFILGTGGGLLIAYLKMRKNIE